MLAQPVYVQDVLETEQCYKCAVMFAFPRSLRMRCRADSNAEFFCPNGHGQVYTKSELTKAQEQLAAEQARHRATLARENEERIAREKLERKLKRVGRGVCPDCNRTFANLARHMNCKHAAK